MKCIRTACLIAAVSTMAVVTAEAGVNVNVNIDAPVPVRVVPPPAPRIVIEEPPEFIMPDPLGFYVAVGVPYDLFLVSNSYYLCRDNVWYRAPHYRGPWVAVRHDHLPPGLRKHRFEKIREIRDHEYRVYRQDRHAYRGRWYKPEKEWKEHRKEDREHRKEERRHDRGERDHGRGHGRGHDD